MKTEKSKCEFVSESRRGQRDTDREKQGEKETYGYIDGLHMQFPSLKIKTVQSWSITPMLFLSFSHGPKKSAGLQRKIGCSVFE